MAGIDDAAEALHSGDDELESRAKKFFLDVMDELDRALHTGTPASRQKLLLASLGQIAKMVEKDRVDERAVQARRELDDLATQVRSGIAAEPLYQPTHDGDLPPMDGAT